LQIDPALRRLPKNPPEPQRQFHGHRSRSIDADAPLSLPVPLQGFEIVRPRNMQVFDSRCGIDLSQSVTGASLNFDWKCSDERTGEEGRRALIGKGEDHETMTNELFIFWQDREGKRKNGGPAKAGD
jgi:hypothetical protein